MKKTDALFLNWPTFHQDCRVLSTRLLALGKWQGIIAITRGGLIPAAILAREMNIRLVDTVCIASYDHQQQGEISVLKSVPHDGEGYLVIDDLVDTGNTAKVIRDMLPKAYFAVIYAKPAAQHLIDTAVKQIPQETWIHFPWDLNENNSYVNPLIDMPNSDDEA